jgi:hypothetical protein
MTPSSRKAKGRALQDWVRDTLREIFPSLEPDEVTCAIMGESGQDIKLSPAARKLIPFSFECKNVEKLNVWAAFEQAVTNCTKINKKTSSPMEPLLIMKKNRRQPLAVIDAKYLLELISGRKKNGS